MSFRISIFWKITHIIHPNRLLSEFRGGWHWLWEARSPLFSWKAVKPIRNDVTIIVEVGIVVLPYTGYIVQNWYSKCSYKHVAFPRTESGSNKQLEVKHHMVHVDMSTEQCMRNDMACRLVMTTTKHNVNCPVLIVGPMKCEATNDFFFVCTILNWSTTAALKGWKASSAAFIIMRLDNQNQWNLFCLGAKVCLCRIDGNPWSPTAAT